jgi:hypothetical protein
MATERKGGSIVKREYMASEAGGKQGVGFNLIKGIYKQA